MILTKLKGIPVTREKILKAMREFDAVYPETNNYMNWLENRVYRFAVIHGDKLYPPKHILSEATGISTKKFNGGDQTNIVFMQLGFTVIKKPQRW